jgi:hypothetical protein
LSETSIRKSVLNNIDNMEFSYSVQADKKILLSVDGDKFSLSLKQIFVLRRVLQNALFDGSVKFKCKIDEPECY